MADNDNLIIKPVEGLHNIAGLTPVKERENRKRQQQSNEKKERRSDTKGQPNYTNDKHLPADPTTDKNERTASGGIDYHA